ncbi:MAG TPA: penicillin-binding protein 2 [Elusimicrobiales bacterium]|nr:penicillin-binding protein 2 [Elusimicrobiales bacterium]
MSVPTLRQRIKFCAIICSLAPVIVSLRLFYLQTIKHENLSRTASRSFDRLVSETGPRGRIFDAQGNLLAESIVTWDCGLMKKELASPSRDLDALSSVLKVPRRTLAQRYARARNYMPVKKGLDRAEYEKLKELNLRGVTLDARQSRYYPSGSLARGLLGVAGEKGGLSGLELLYDKVLAGTVSKREVVRDAAGRIIYGDTLQDGGLPMDLHLTLDKRIQFFAQESVKKYTESTRAKQGIVIVQDPRNGNILAMASWPENLNQVVPVEWVYEPGSTFKSITFAAALDTGKTSPSEKFFCENGKWQFAPRVAIGDHEPEGTLTLSQVLERSSNIGTAKLGMQLGLQDFYRYAKAFGYGTRTGLGFFGESSGIMRPASRYKPVDLAVGSYGHGLAATPIQVVNSYSAIANGGLLMEPRLVARVADPARGKEREEKPAVIRRVAGENAIRTLKRMLRAVVTKGTGKTADVAGYSIAGKTGTSKTIDEYGKYVSGKNVASFAGFFPLEEPLYTILVIIDQPKAFNYGSETAAPAFREIASRIITATGLPPDVRSDGPNN